MKQIKAKEMQKASVSAALRKVMSGLVKGYIDDVKTNSSVDVSVIGMKFDDFKKQLIERQNKNREELKLTRDELKETFREAKQSVKELLKGEVATMDNLFGEFEFDDTDFTDYEDPGLESEEVKTYIPEPEEKLNRFALMILFHIGGINKEFNQYLVNNQASVIDLIARVRLTKTDPVNLDTIIGTEYRSIAMESEEYVKQDLPEPKPVDRSTERDHAISIIKDLDKVFNEDRIATTAVYAILYKAQFVYNDYIQRQNPSPALSSEAARIGEFANIVINSYVYYEMFVELSKGVLPSDLDALYVAMAWEFGLLYLTEKHPDLHSRICGVLCGDE